MGKPIKNICMIVYTEYLSDTRVRREAETLAALPEFNVTVLSLNTGVNSSSYDVDGVKVVEMKEKKYCGKSQVQYLLSYFKFMLMSFLCCVRFFISKKIDVIHVHNMPNFLVFAGIVPRLFGKRLVLDVHDSVPETYMAKFNAYNPLLFWAVFLLQFNYVDSKDNNIIIS